MEAAPKKPAPAASINATRIFPKVQYILSSTTIVVVHNNRTHTWRETTSPQNMDLAVRRRMHVSHPQDGSGRGILPQGCSYRRTAAFHSGPASWHVHRGREGNTLVQTVGHLHGARETCRTGLTAEAYKEHIAVFAEL